MPPRPSDDGVVDVFRRPKRVPTERGPRAKTTREKPRKNQWCEEERQLMSKDEATDPSGSRHHVLNAVGRDLNLYRYASADLRSDRKWVLSVVMQDWRALEHTSEELKGDREIVLEAVKQDGRAMAFASKNMKNDKEIVLAVMKAHPEDSFVAASSCRAIARLATNQPNEQEWFGSRGACLTIVSAMARLGVDKAVQLQGSRAMVALLCTVGTVDKLPTPHEVNQDLAGRAGLGGVVVKAIENFVEADPVVIHAVVECGQALVRHHAPNAKDVERAYEAATALGVDPTREQKAAAKAVRTAAREVLSAFQGQGQGLFPSVNPAMAKGPTLSKGPTTPLSPTPFQRKLFKATKVFEPASSYRGTDEQSLFDQLRGGGGMLHAQRKSVLGKISCVIGTQTTSEEALAEKYAMAPKFDRPPTGKPSGIATTTVSYHVTS